MQFETKTITLKDGRSALLRAPVASDAPALLGFLKTITSETHFLLREREECDLSVEQEEAWITRLNESEHDIMILCEVDGRIVGNADLHVRARRKTLHRGTLGIGIIREFWNLGIGSALFGQLIDVGRSTKLEQLELSYVEGNERGCALYEKMGFTEIARHPNAFHLPDGSSAAEIFMVKTL